MENKRKLDNTEVKSRKKRKVRESFVLQDITNSSNSNSNANSNSNPGSNVPCQAYFDIDSIGKNDPENCTIYARDIAGWLLTTEEVTNSYLPNFQKDVNQKMRTILIDWLVEVAEQYEVSSKALFLAKKVVDLMLSKIPFQRQQLQLLGVVSLLIATKFEDVQCLQVSELVFITDSSCSAKDIKDLEVTVLNTLEYRLTIPTEIDFLPRLLKAACHKYDSAITEKISKLANYFAEVTLLHYSFLKFKSSVVAVACVALALATAGLVPWDSTLEYYSPPRNASFVECLRELLSCLKTQEETSVFKKYSHRTFGSVASLPLPSCVPYFGI